MQTLKINIHLFRYGPFLSLILFALMLLPGPANAATFCVSTANELSTALFTAASNGEDDLVQMVQETYEGAFVYTSQEARDLSIEGGYTAGCSSRTVDAANTVLDGMGTGTVLVLISTQESTFAVDGLTMQHGSATNGNGGGLFASPSGGDFTLTNTTLSGNTASSHGGGVYVTGATNVTVTNTTLSANTASSYGGGVYVTGASNVTLTNTTFSGNTASSYGGGIYVTGASNVTLTNTTFSGNTASRYSGGGVCVTGASSVTLTNTTLSGNTAGSGGGGVSVGGTNVTFTNNTLSGNTAGSGGGGVYVAGATSVTFTNNTLNENTANSTGGGILLYLGSNDASADIYNNIVWANSAPQGADLYLNNDGNGDFIASPVNLFCNDFDHSTIYRKIFFPIDASNLDNRDPLFVDAANGDFHLLEGSPVIDKGCNDAPERPDTDKDGRPRIVNDVVDMGAYEYQEVSEWPDINVDPPSLDFGDVVVGACRDQEVTIMNSGTADLVVHSVTTDTSDLAIISPSFPQTIAPDANAPVTVRFCPADPGPFNGSLTIDSNDLTDPTLEVPCTGMGVQADPCDADGDGDVDFQDAIAVLKYLWKGTPLLGDGDCNQDDQITFRDVLAIIQASR
jgi:parallel beta-helix repeat protein